MQLTLEFALLAALAMTVYQDFKYRAIWWGLIPILLLAFFARSLQSISVSELLTSSALNLGFVALQMALVTTYVSIRNKAFTNILKAHFGVGDLLFMVALAFAWSVPGFIVFHVVALLLVLLASIPSVLAATEKPFQIPLAGGMALVMMLCLVLANSSIQFDPRHADFLIPLLP